MEAQVCAQCGYTLFESGRFCPQCGAAQVKVCSVCKAENAPEAKFCSQCGTDFGKVKKSKAPPKRKPVRSKSIDGKIWIIAAAGIILITAGIWYIAVSEKGEDAATGGGPGMTIDPNMQQTLKRLQTQLNQNPENIQTWIQLGNLYYDNGNFQESIFHYQHALLMDSTNVNVRVDMAIGYYSTGQPERAVEEMKKALAFDPNHLNALFNIGIVLSSMGERDEARRYWEQYLALSPAGNLAERIRTMMSEWH